MVSWQKPINMERGIFQGCPISPYLFVVVIETMALAIRQNDNIRGIPIHESQLKISLLADDSTCFLITVQLFLLIVCLTYWINLLLVLAVKLIFLNQKLFGLERKGVRKFSAFWKRPNLENL